MDLGLHDRHVVVTGASSGLGLATARVLVDEGARVTLVARDPAKVADAVRFVGTRAEPLVVDLTDDDAGRAVVEGAQAVNGDMHGLFVSHGGPPPGPASALDDDRLRTSFDVAALAPIRVVRQAASAIGAGGAIAVLTSMSSREPIDGLASSNVMRPAVWGYVKSLADELGPRGVRVNAVLPGRYDTARLRELEADIARRQGGTTDDVRAASEAAIPLRRLGDPAELGRVAAFLLSPAASFVTGAAWAVDGGALRGL